MCPISLRQREDWVATKKICSRCLPCIHSIIMRKQNQSGINKNGYSSVNFVFIFILSFRQFALFLCNYRTIKIYLQYSLIRHWKLEVNFIRYTWLIEKEIQITFTQTCKLLFTLKMKINFRLQSAIPIRFMRTIGFILIFYHLFTL